MTGRPQIDEAHKTCLASKCKGCCHYRSVASQGDKGLCVCHYLIDTGQTRPKFDFMTESCPVKAKKRKKKNTSIFDLQDETFEGA